MLWRKLIFYPKPPWFPNFNDKFYSGCYPANSVRVTVPQQQAKDIQTQLSPSGKWGVIAESTHYFFLR